MNLFNEEKFVVTITPEAQMIKEFKALIARDKTKDKRKSTAELAFVYFYIDFKSPYIRYTKDERIAKVSDDVLNDPGFSPDKAVWDAIDKYSELHETPSIRTLTAIRDGLMTSTRVIELVKSRVDQRIEQASEINNQGEDDDDEDSSIDISALVDDITTLLDLSQKVPKAITTIEQLEDKVKKEQSSEKKIKGGGGENLFENP
jgi:hypothetical protein